MFKVKTTLRKHGKRTQDTLPPNRGSRKDGRLDPTSLFINNLQCSGILTLEENFEKIKE